MSKRKFYWYRLTINYGPGRQGQDTEYFFTLGNISKSDRKEIEIEKRAQFDDYEYGPAVVRLRKVNTIPAQEIQILTQKANDTIRAMNLRLEALSALQK